MLSILLYGDTERHRHMIHSSLLILSACALNEEHVQLKPTNEIQRLDSVIALVQLAIPTLHKDGACNILHGLCEDDCMIVLPCDTDACYVQLTCSGSQLSCTNS